jgi:MFS family permease
VDDEVAAIEEAIEQEKEEQPYSVLFTDPSIRKRVIIANMLQWLQQFTGINAMVGYGPSVFIALGLPLDPNVANFTAQAFNLVGTIIMMTVIDKMGRRPLLISGAVVMFLTMFIAGIIQEAWNVDKSATKAWIQFSLLCVYFLGFAIAWGGVPWVYPSEIFPMEIKEKALSTSVFSQWMANFVIAQIVQRLIASIGIGYTFLFFSAFLFFAIFYVYFFVPETKGVPLEDMDKLFGPRQYHNEVVAIHTPVHHDSV